MYLFLAKNQSTIIFLFHLASVPCAYDDDGALSLSPQSTVHSMDPFYFWLYWETHMGHHLIYSLLV